MKCQRVFFPLFVVCLGFCFAVTLFWTGTRRPCGANIIIDGGADLALTSIKGPRKAFLNQTISITYEVTNQGMQIPGLIRSVVSVKGHNHRSSQRSSLEGNHLHRRAADRANQEDHHQGDHAVRELSGLYYYGGVVGSSSNASLNKVSIVRFEADSLNGTVTDHNTGLMWQQVDDGITRTWSEAKTYCNGSCLAGITTGVCHASISY